MEKLSENAERIWKVLSHYSQGATVKRLRQITAMSKTTVYDSLKELESKGFVEHQSPKWIPKAKEEFSTETEHKEATSEPLWKKQFFEHKDRIMRAIANKDPDDLVKVPEAALNYLKSDLPSEIKEKLPELKELERKIAWVFKQQDVDWFPTQVYRADLLEDIALSFVSELYGKA